MSCIRIVLPEQFVEPVFRQGQDAVGYRQLQLFQSRRADGHEKRRDGLDSELKVGNAWLNKLVTGQQIEAHVAIVSPPPTLLHQVGV